ncbi:PREDICTED: UV radiation resistance-associated gene protein isoform X2 [Lepidothrix coronata]|uniref:UV radiation resistance-associated gene protein isoform X1 n=1 Tax=Lepidothrix coronata TaxID=321398 RepID=A0A6J0IZS8_9PASS|nr:PREDICTED: UV radiation resistance-associated gene protein isoform X1 [Lepidothrix coronata]XP_017691509.1 PREDICTED: UV radiation resistance-associated gene protein isoform X2 [Lepidothrix coronata]
MSSAAGPAALPPGSAARALHVELPSQQRRLRHLRNIAARNIINRNGYRLLDTYFTLHLCDSTKIYKEFYKSEVIKNSLNPTWRSLDFGLMPDRLDTSVSCFVVRIWGGKKEHFQLLIEWKVNLDGLKYLGQQIHARNPNEIIFGLHDGYYGASFEQKDHSGTLKNSLLQVDQNCVRNSYDVFSLLRLHRAQCAIKQTQVTVQRIGREIEEKLRCTSTRNELKKESECLQLKILVLRNELERQKKALGQEVALLHKQKSSLSDRENAFGTEYEKLGEHNESLCELRKECTAKREQLLKTNAQQTIRCKQLLSELSYIYPIDLNDQKDYFVCGVKLPNSEDFQAKDDGSIAVALGYTAHLVSMISFFLQVPLRYPIIHKGSRSTIKDNINDKLTEKEREFPLYPKGGEKLQFEYGVYLLNKNIAQLRYQHGLSTPDLRQTLPNLKNFMEIGLMVRCDRHHTSSAIPVPKRQSSSFGRLHIGFSSGLPSPDKGLRKRATSTGNERLQYKTPPPSYSSALTQPVPAGEPQKTPGPISSSLDTSLDSSKGTAGKGEDSCGGFNGESGALVPPPRGRRDPSPGGCSAINGAAGPGARELPPPGPALCCAVEQAEEIMGMEATALGPGDQLEDFNSIPVEHAVAVECDEQVLGEFEEFSRRIYALNENMSSFRRARKSSDK